MKKTSNQNSHLDTSYEEEESYSNNRMALPRFVDVRGNDSREDD